MKSKTLRKRHGTVLTANVRNLMKPIDPEVKVRWLWDKIELEFPALNPTSSTAQKKQIITTLACVPGLSHFEEVVETDFLGFEQSLQFVLDEMSEQLVDKTFAVRVRRRGQHDFSSQDMAVYIGGGIRARVAGTQVQLTQPECTVQLWLDQDKLSLLVKRHEGLGGYPLPTQETVVSLISGGFDSAVASYQLIRRGARTHFCFFDLGGGGAHEAAVKEVAYYIWQKYSATHPVKFVSVDLSEVVEAILTQPEQGVMGVLLKRAMLRAGAQVAARLRAQALVTGEAVGQVSSQTLSNLQIIDEVVSTLVIRPLIVMDKQQIVDQARAIGVEQMAAAIPEYCGVISKRPTVKAKRQVVQAAEQGITDALIEAAVAQAKVEDIREVHQTPDIYLPQIITQVQELPAGAVIIDIRSPEEEEEAPLQVAGGVEVQHIPFFKLAREIKKLDPNKNYALYCQQGVMSRLQAISLKEQGVQGLLLYEPRE